MSTTLVMEKEKNIPFTREKKTKNLIALISFVLVEGNFQSLFVFRCSFCNGKTLRANGYFLSWEENNTSELKLFFFSHLLGKFSGSAAEETKHTAQNIFNVEQSLCCRTECKFLWISVLGEKELVSIQRHEHCVKHCLAN